MPQICPNRIFFTILYQKSLQYVAFVPYLIPCFLLEVYRTKILFFSIACLIPVYLLLSSNIDWKFLEKPTCHIFTIVNTNIHIAFVSFQHFKYLQSVCCRACPSVSGLLLHAGGRQWVYSNDPRHPHGEIHSVFYHYCGSVSLAPTPGDNVSFLTLL